MNDHPPYMEENPDLEHELARGESDNAEQQASPADVEPDTRYTVSTERLLEDLAQEIGNSLLAHLRVCRTMLELSAQGDVQATPGGLHVVIKARWQRRLSSVWISQHWAVADRLLRHVALEFLHSAGWQDFDVLYQAAVWVGEQRKKPHQHLAPTELASKALETFSVLNRDEARAYRDPLQGATLDTGREAYRSTSPTPPSVEPTQTATAHYTPPGTFPVSTVNRYEAAVEHFKTVAAAVLQEKHESPLSPTLTLEVLSDLLTGFGTETTAALLRLHETGASGADGSRLLAVYLLAEISVDPVALKCLGSWLTLERDGRSVHELARILLDAADARARVQGVQP